jgi:hypothetical protein
MLLIVMPGDQGTPLELPLDARFHPTRDLWHAFLKGPDPSIQFTYCMGRAPNPEPYLHRFDLQVDLIAPYPTT